MTPEIALLLAQDGISTGAIYVLVALGLVLVFLVTRVIFVPFGDVIGYAALTLAALQLKQMPGTVWLVVTLGVAAKADAGHVVAVAGAGGAGDCDGGLDARSPRPGAPAAEGAAVLCGAAGRS